MTVKTRISLFIVGAGLISSLLFSVVVFFELIEQPFRLLDIVLREEAYRTARILVREREGSDSRVLDTLSQELGQYWVEIYDRDTRTVLFRSGLAKLAKLPPVNPGSRAIARPVVAQEAINSHQSRIGKTVFRVRTFSIDLDGRSFIVQVARSMEKLNEEIWELVFGIVAGLIFSILVLIAISRFVAGKIIQPIGEIKDLAQDISEKNLDRRIPLGEGRDELSELAGTINRMLDRLQYSFVRQRDFLFDTSHELKTPLTTMRLAVDEVCAVDWNDMPSLMKDNLSRLNSQVLRMERLVKDLLNLSSLETLSRIDSHPVDVSGLLSSLTGEYAFLADARNIKMNIRLSAPLIIRGDEEKLRRAFSNILDNAVKYNVDGGRIDLTAEQSVAGLTIAVTNTGPGVAEVEIPRVFDQFYRVEKSRSTEHGGSGLGLAIVRRIVELHGGEVAFESRQGDWTRVTVRLPRSRENIRE